MLVEFVTDIDSPSGYSKFARDFIYALHEYGGDLKVKIITNKHDRTTIPLNDWWMEHLPKFLNQTGVPDVRMHIETPEFYRPATNVVNVGFTFWETDRIPSEPRAGEPPWPDQRCNWVRQMNMMSEIWTSASFAVDSFVDSGVKVPVNVIGIPIEQVETDEEIRIRNVNVDMGDRPIPVNERPFVIGSCAQWTWRKNLDELIIAVASEFRADEAVLVLKTYGAAQNTPTEEQRIHDRAIAVRNTTGLKNSPRIVLVQDTLSDQEMARFYNSLDMFVMPSRGEGFCIPAAQAMLHEIPVLSTGWSAMTDYIRHEETGWLIDYTMEPVYGMPHIPWYRPDQNWARINVRDLMRTMREVYNLIREEAPLIERVTTDAKSEIKNRFSYHTIGKTGRAMLEEAAKNGTRFKVGSGRDMQPSIQLTDMPSASSSS